MAAIKRIFRVTYRQVLDYRVNQHERNEMEHARRRVDIKLRTESVRKVSLYTLRITKTEAACQRQMKDWNEDIMLLKKNK